MKYFVLALFCVFTNIGATPLNETDSVRTKELLVEFRHLHIFLDGMESEDQWAEFDAQSQTFAFSALTDPLGPVLVDILDSRQARRRMSLSSPTRGHLAPDDWMGDLKVSGSLMSLYASVLENTVVGEIRASDCAVLDVLYDGLERSLTNVKLSREKVQETIALEVKHYVSEGPALLDSEEVNASAITRAEELLGSRC